jgi:hypothetical protein
MKRVRIVLAAAALATAASGAQAPAASALTVNCGLKSYTFLFWPHGHSAVPSVKFPAYPVPHMEFYKPGNTYPNANSLGYTDAGGQGGFSTSKCRKVTRGTVGSRVPAPGSTTSASALKCTFPRTVKFDLVRMRGGTRFRAYLGAMPVVSAKVLTAGSSLTFAKAYCRRTAPPH